LHDLSLPLLAFVAGLAGSLVTAPLLISGFGRAPGLRRRRPDEVAPSVPRLGGVAVLAGLVCGVVLALWWSGWSGTLLRATRYQWIGWILALGCLFLWGLVDDLRGLTPRAKLAMQAAGALVVYMAGFRIDFVTVPGLGTTGLGWAALPVTILWVVGVVNAFNFIDGLDGLAAGVALISTGTIAVISYVQGIFPVTVLSTALAGSLVGFLVFNFSPARITLGDSGSQLLGFTLAVISMRGLQKSATAVAVFAPALVLGLPILDMLLVVARRGWRIRVEPKPTEGSSLARWGGIARRDREHIHHNLVDLGLSDRKAAVVLYLTTAAFCAGAAGLVLLQRPALVLALAACTAGGTALAKLAAVRQRSRREPTPMPPVSAGPGSPGSPRSSKPHTTAGAVPGSP